MPKRYNIRVSDKDRELLKKLNKDISNKNYYLSTNYLIDTGMQRKSMKEFTTRAEFNKFKKEVERFKKNQFVQEKQTVRGLAAEVKRINEVKNTELARYKELGITPKEIEYRQGLGDVRFSNFREMKFDLKRYKSLKDAATHLRELRQDYEGNFFEEWNERLRENYLSALKKVFGDDETLTGRLSKLEEHIKNLDIDEVIKAYYTKDKRNIHFIYEKLLAKEDILDAILEDWDI
jgi:hypothetical protein